MKNLISYAWSEVYDMTRKPIVLSVAGIVCACIIIACYIEITNCKQVWIETYRYYKLLP